MQNKWARIALLIFVSWFNNNFLVAQEVSSDTIYLIKWLGAIEEKYDISFSYNHELLTTIKINQSSCPDLQVCLDMVSSVVPIIFEESGNDNYLILPVRRTAQFKVLDKESNESIAVILAKINDDKGFYVLPENDLISISDLFWTDSVEISSTFYSPLKIQAHGLFASNPEVRLAPEPILLGEVVIKDYLTEGIDVNLSDHSMRVSMNDMSLLAGETDGDILNLLKSLPGIRTPDGKPGNLNFRGSTFDQTMILYDNVPIYHTGHYFGAISPYNSSAVSDIEIHRNTPPAKWGGRVGGIIRMETSTPNIDSAEYELAANTVYAGAGFAAPIVKNKLGVSLYARSSYPWDFLSPKLQAFSILNFQGSKIDAGTNDNFETLDEFNIKFSDVISKVAFAPNDKNLFEVSYVNVSNEFGFEFSRPLLQAKDNENVNLDNKGISGKWIGEFGSNTRVNLNLTSSSFDLLNEFEEIQNGQPPVNNKFINQLLDTRIGLEIDQNISEKSSLNVGYSLVDHTIKFQTRLSAQPTTSITRVAQIHSFYSSLKTNWGESLVANFGLHGDYYAPTNETFVDPRISLSYRISNFLFLKSSAGRSHQYIYQRSNNDFNDFRVSNQFWFLANKREQPMEGYRGMVGLLRDKGGWLFDVEFYANRTNNVVQEITIGNPDVGVLKSIGMDVLLKRQWLNFQSWISYSLSQVKTDFGTEDFAYYDQPHLLNLMAIWKLDNWNFALSWSFASGMPVVLPTTPLDVPYSGRFPNQHQLDLSATYQFWNKPSKKMGVIGFSFLNLYNQENIINIFQSNTRVDYPYRYGVGFAPNVHVKISF